MRSEGWSMSNNTYPFYLMVGCVPCCLLSDNDLHNPFQIRRVSTFTIEVKSLAYMWGMIETVTRGLYRWQLTSCLDGTTKVWVLYKTILSSCASILLVLNVAAKHWCLFKVGDDSNSCRLASSKTCNRINIGTILLVNHMPMGWTDQINSKVHQLYNSYQFTIYVYLQVMLRKLGKKLVLKVCFKVKAVDHIGKCLGHCWYIRRMQYFRCASFNFSTLWQSWTTKLMLTLA